MNEPASADPAGVPTVGQPHPLLADRPRLNRIMSNMDITIQRTLYGHTLGDGQERLLHGGVSARDVLQEALLDLLRYDPARLTASWEGLSVTIARRRAVDAVRESVKGRRAVEAAVETQTRSPSSPSTPCSTSTRARPSAAGMTRNRPSPATSSRRCCGG